MVFGSSVPSSTQNVYKTRSQIWTPYDKRSGTTHVKDWAILEPYVQTDESQLALFLRYAWRKQTIKVGNKHIEKWSKMKRFLVPKQLERFLGNSPTDWSLTHNSKFVRERSDLMVECLTRDRRVTGSSLTCDTAAVCVLEQETLISSKYCFNPGRPTWHDSKTQIIN